MSLQTLFSWEQNKSTAIVVVVIQSLSHVQCSCLENPMDRGVAFHLEPCLRMCITLFQQTTTWHWTSEQCRFLSVFPNIPFPHSWPLPFSEPWSLHAQMCVPVCCLHYLSCVFGRFDGETELLTDLLTPLPDHPDFRYSGYSSDDTRGSLGTGPTEGLIPETLVREVAIEH